jgi:hypothetical protein
MTRRPRLAFHVRRQVRQGRAVRLLTQDYGEGQGYLQGQDRCPFAAVRIRKLMATIGPQAAQFVRDTLKDVVSESVKKAIWGS